MFKPEAIRQICLGRDPVRMQEASVRARRRNIRKKQNAPLAWQSKVKDLEERPDWWDK